MLCSYGTVVFPPSLCGNPGSLLDGARKQVLPHPPFYSAVKKGKRLVVAVDFVVSCSRVKFLVKH